MTGTATLPGFAPEALTDLLRVAAAPDFDRWRDQIRRTGGCANPIHLTGWTTTQDKTTGRLLHHTTSDDQPGGRLRVACGNRRASRCAPCSYLYAGDAYRLIRAGLCGDDVMRIPAAVRERPRVFLTLTAPSFGPVHNQPDTGRCRCGVRHRDDDPALGTALNPSAYDYAGTVLFNNHAGDLWHRFVNRLRREIALRAGLTQREFADVARLSYGKVAEFQNRGVIHFHAVIRLDGPEGSASQPPAWATLDLLTDAIAAAHRHPYTRVTVPAVADQPARDLTWGARFDVRPITAFATDDINEGKVAAYVAKYATKAAESTGATDRAVYCGTCRGSGGFPTIQHADGTPVYCRTCEGSGMGQDPATLPVPDHIRRLMLACADLQRLYPKRMLARWAHMLGFRGHFLTKSRAYSSTFTERRQVRADYRADQQRQALGLPDPDTTLVLAHWRYAGHGHTPGESWIAAGIAEDIRTNRETAREARADLVTPGEW
ncbi:replication initiator [Streptomyces sp. NPDC046853]|uniref:replication initiator n=1 Tax=Streptomyces sp. NPDC046853 TaxID=3154920 RepID=UPI003410DA9C